MSKVLLIKTGAAGDIVRTTVLLNFLIGEITWVIDKKYIDILPDSPQIKRVIPIEDAYEELRLQEFGLTISLEENLRCAWLASNIKAQKIIGIKLDDGKIGYTPDSASWFDMGLISRYGPAYANEMKAGNTKTFQFHLLNMLGLPFNAEPYCTYKNIKIKTIQCRIGIETRVGLRWPNKGWLGYAVLQQKLEQENYEVILLQEKEKIRDYLDEIATCDIIISGDTLAMHIALAYQKKCITIFNCTSPAEIYGYGLQEKIISPLLMSNFYSNHFSQEVIASVQLQQVYDVVLRMLEKPTI